MDFIFSSFEFELIYTILKLYLNQFLAHFINHLDAFNYNMEKLIFLLFLFFFFFFNRNYKIWAEIHRHNVQLAL